MVNYIASVLVSVWGYHYISIKSIFTFKKVELKLILFCFLKARVITHVWFIFAIFVLLKIFPFISHPIATTGSEIKFLKREGIPCCHQVIRISFPLENIPKIWNFFYFQF